MAAEVKTALGFLLLTFLIHLLLSLIPTPLHSLFLLFLLALASTPVVFSQGLILAELRMPSLLLPATPAPGHHRAVGEASLGSPDWLASDQAPQESPKWNRVWDGEGMR